MRALQALGECEGGSPAVPEPRGPPCTWGLWAPALPPSRCHLAGQRAHGLSLLGAPGPPSVVLPAPGLPRAQPLCHQHNAGGGGGQTARRVDRVTHTSRPGGSLSLLLWLPACDSGLAGFLGWFPFPFGINKIKMSVGISMESVHGLVSCTDQALQGSAAPVGLGPGGSSRTFSTHSRAPTSPEQSWPEGRAKPCVLQALAEGMAGHWRPLCPPTLPLPLPLSSSTGAPEGA